MGKISFLFKKLSSMDYGNIKRIAKKVHQEHKRPYLTTLADILWCGLRYQAAPSDYIQSGMYKLNHDQRSDIITAGVNNSFVTRNCDLAQADILNDKFQMYKHFEDFLKRKYTFISGAADKPAYLEMAASLNEIIVKPATETGGGKGVKRFSDKEAAWEYALSIMPSIAEEAIVQDERLAALNPTSVNTLRPITLLKDEEVIFLAAYLRIGAGGVVDNFCDGGMIAPVNMDTGLIDFPAADENVNYYSTHPITGVSIVGFKVPFMEEIKEMVISAARSLPQLRYIGWDIAITPQGPCIIEGNVFPSHAFFNFEKHHPDGKYLRREFERKMEGK